MTDAQLEMQIRQLEGQHAGNPVRLSVLLDAYRLLRDSRQREKELASELERLRAINSDMSAEPFKSEVR